MNSAVRYNPIGDQLAYVMTAWVITELLQSTLFQVDEILGDAVSIQTRL